MIFRISKILFAFLGVLLFATSCLDNEIGQREDEANQKLNAYISSNGYTEANNIGYGIYVKVLEEGDPDGAIAKVGQRVLMSFTGSNTFGVVFESTDSTLSQALAYPDVHIYGPKRYLVGGLIFGMDTALRTLPEGAKAEIVIPHQYAFGDYEPVVYNVDIHEVIENDSIYEADMFNAFLTNNMFSDTINEGLYYKLAEGDTLNSTPVFSKGDSVFLKVNAHFAEDYYADNTGRLFYPRPFEYDTFWYEFKGVKFYPVLPAFDSVLQYMNVNQEVEIAFASGAHTSGNVWGLRESGYVDPYFNIYIIEPYTPLHYKIELLRTTAEESN